MDCNLSGITPRLIYKFVDGGTLREGPRRYSTATAAAQGNDDARKALRRLGEPV